MPKRTREYRDSLLEDLQDHNEAAAYLNAALADSQEMFLTALRDVAAAVKVAKVAEDAGIAREAVYQMLSKTGNPRLSSLSGILKALGLQMYFKSAQKSDTDTEATGTVSRNAIRGLQTSSTQGIARKKEPSSESTSLVGSFIPGQFAPATRHQYALAR
jgi:probable addiction module antidote protein